MLGGGLTRLRGAVGRKGAERSRTGNRGARGEVREDQEGREAGAAAPLGLGGVEHMGTRAGVQSTGLGNMPALLPTEVDSNSSIHLSLCSFTSTTESPTQWT